MRNLLHYGDKDFKKIIKRWFSSKGNPYIFSLEEIQNLYPINNTSRFAQLARQALEEDLLIAFIPYHPKYQQLDMLSLAKTEEANFDLILDYDTLDSGLNRHFVLRYFIDMSGLATYKGKTGAIVACEFHREPIAAFHQH